jgi:hypothetical protein
MKGVKTTSKSERKVIAKSLILDFLMSFLLRKLCLNKVSYKIKADSHFQPLKAAKAFAAF